ncbi:MAG: hypothetical protein ACEY3C_07395 [Candidatus Tisiphia sp.]
MIKFKHPNSVQYTLSLMVKVRNIFAVNVGFGMKLLKDFLLPEI